MQLLDRSSSGRVWVHSGDGLHHVLPTEPVGKVLGQLRYLTILLLYPGVSPHGPRDARERFDGERRNNRQGCDRRPAYNQYRRVHRLQPAPPTLSDKPFEHQPSGGEQHGIRRGEKVKFGALERKKHEEYCVDPTQQAIRFSRTRKQIMVKSRKPDRQGSRVHGQDLLNEEPYWGSRSHLSTVIPPELQGGPAMPDLPVKVWEQENKRDRAATL